MVVLNRNVIKIFSIFLIAALATISGCLVAQKLGLSKEPIRFSHKKHLQDIGEDLECSSCHRKAATSDEAGMPNVRQCLLCHEGVDEEKPEEKRIAKIYGEKPEWSHVTAIPEEVKFSHKTHIEAEVACNACHVGIEQSTRITAKVKLDMNACLKCHAQKAVARDCETCHQQIRKDWEPDSHKHNWVKFHGQTVRAETGLSADNCSVCHTEATCSSCHQDQLPENHNNQWRHRGHWVAASMDRDNCSVCHKPDFCDRCHRDTEPRSHTATWRHFGHPLAANANLQSCTTCHRTDFCDRCHRETEPRNHTGGWGSPRNRHCNTCHIPLQNETCSTCHRDNPSHAQLAAPKPAVPPHSAAMNCRQCHGGGGAAPFPHPDNGDDCNICHQ